VQEAQAVVAGVAPECKEEEYKKQRTWRSRWVPMCILDYFCLDLQCICLLYNKVHCVALNCIAMLFIADSCDVTLWIKK
jgi:hypothetical protein